MKRALFLWAGITLGVICYSNIDLNAQIHYTELAEGVGITHTYGAGNFGGGVCFFDFNKDGWDDLTLATGLGDTLQFYLNNNGVFEKLPPFVSNDKRARQVLWADYDNDDDYDLFILTYESGCYLYENDGDFNLTDITAQAGFFQDPRNSYSATWGDYNNDGLLDLYVGNSGFPNALYKNLSGGNFEEVTIQAGVEDEEGFTLCHAFLDFDKDGWLDIYVSNDKWTPNKLFRNNGDGTFEDYSAFSNTGIVINAMSVSVGDFDNDGWDDIYITNSKDMPSVLFHNLGNNTFEDVAEMTGVEFYSDGWSAQWLDADLDLDLDLYVSSALIGIQVQTNTLYENMGDNTFSIPENAGFAGDTLRSYSNAIGDYNNDGSPDIFVLHHLFNSKLWRNDQDAGHWLKIGLKGTVSNRDGIGSRIEVYANGQVLSRFTHCGESYLAQNSQYKHFGLGDYTTVDSIIVRWPSGIVDKLFEVVVDQLITIEETDCTTSANIISSNVSCFGASDGTIEIISTEGNPPFYYHWSTGETTNTISDLNEGMYFLTITDANSCPSYIDIEITAPNSIQVTGMVTNASCQSESDGIIETSISGGVSPYSYLWQDSTLQSDYLNAPAGVYTLTITDSNGCTKSFTTQVFEPDSLEISIVEQNIIQCLGDSTGIIGIDAMGGTPPYDYFWSNENITAINDNLPAGFYSVTTTDSQGCTANIALEILVNDTIPPSIICPDDITSFDCNGEVTYDLPLVMDNCSFVIPELIDGLGSGGIFPSGTSVEQYRVTDQNGNVTSCSFTITIENTLETIITQTLPSCFGQSSGEATAEGIGGIPDYSFLWSNGQNTSTVTDLSAGNYNVTITDITGCTNSAMVTIDEFPEIEFILDGIMDEIGQSGNGAIEISITGGTPPYIFEWTGDDGFTSANEDIQNLSTGNYSCLITDANGCTVSTGLHTVNTLVSLHEDRPGDQVLFFPNPTTGKLFLQLKLMESLDFNISVYDINGELLSNQIHRCNNDLYQIDLSTYSNGIYLLQCTYHQQVVFKRVVLYKQ